MRTYETVMVIDSLIKIEEIDGIIERTEKIIENNGGKITLTERWGKKRLAYEIKKRQYGYYVEIIFAAPVNLVNILEDEYRLQESILRYLTVHLNSRAIEYLQLQKFSETESEQELDNSHHLDNEEKQIEIVSDNINEGELSVENLNNTLKDEPSSEEVSELEKDL